MASGWGINGTKGRCYDFWVDFSECMSRCREPKDCSLLREDYLECLHHSKERTEFHALRVLETPKWARIGSIGFSRQSFANE
ncbi:hypothetical protein Golob_012848 [Gossypium lobatum]|uniref:Uncharacterized protein n=1 Tax=Gossypium lobatum TaxID=34289 RepID=A0A7J8LMP7_9ROSI|nr:hypothetical protein [Gossypium lobatum]